MDLKAEKVIGLNEWAKKVVASRGVAVEELHVSGKEIATFGDGTYATVPVFAALVENKKEEYDKFYGLFYDPLPLHKYTMPNGEVYLEVVQEQPPDTHALFIFLAFKNGQGEFVKNSVWSEEAMKEAIRKSVR